tara:strand:- start:36796 stop:40296 length:3501 start_codon:yes stop_codon:yes gene_type:complete
MVNALKGHYYRSILIYKTLQSMHLYTTILVELLILSSSILLLFRSRVKLGLAPLYILLGSVQYLQALSGTMISFKLFGSIPIYPGSVIVFSAVLFAILLIYIKEGVESARALIIGVIISNFILSALFGVTYVQEQATQILSIDDASSVFQINYKFFITGTLLLLIDFILLIIIYQFLISKFKKPYFFLVLLSSLLIVLLFDSFAFNLLLKYNTPNFANSLTGHIIGKSFSAIVFSALLYFYLKYIDKEKENVSFIASQNRDVFSILNYKKKYLDLKEEKQQVEKKFKSHLETTLNNISDGFISLDTNWCYTYINEKGAEFIGKTAESLIGKHIWTEFPEGVNLPFYKKYHEAVETQKTIYFEDYYEPQDKWFENRIYPSPEGLTVYFTDITEQKKVATNNQLLLSLIETSDDFVGLATLEGKPTYLNTNGRQLVGLTSNEELADSITDFFPQNYKEVIVNEHVPNIYKKNKWSGEVEFKNFKTGELIPIEMSGFLIKDKLTKKPLGLGIVAADITDRKEAEEKLISSELLFRGLSENAPVAIFQTDKKGSCNYVNEQWIKYSGISFNEALGFGWSKALHPDDREKVLEIWNRAVFTGTEFITDLRFLDKKGKTTWLTAKAVGLYDARNELYGYIGTLLDITERKETENKIIKSEKYLDNIINNIGDPVFVKDDQSSLLVVNDAFCSLFNLSKADIIGKTLAENVPLEERDSFLKIDKQVIQTGIENVQEESLTLTGKETRIVSTKKTRFIDSSNTKFLVGVIRDITDRIKAEIALKENEEKFAKAFESKVIGKAILNKEKKIIEINEALTNMVGFEKENMLGKTTDEIGLFNFYKEKNLENRNKLWSEFNKKGYVSNFELQYVLQSGIELFVLISLQSLQLNNEGHVLVTVLDITEKKQVESELEKHRNNLEELIELRTAQLEKEKIKAQSADLMKSAFLATMSHELRTPMNSIIGFTGILLKEFAGPLNEEQKKQLAMVKNSSQHLLGLINDVLDISKIEAGKLKVSIYPFNYITTLEKTIDFLVPQALKKNLRIQSEIAELKLTIYSDERRVEQVLLNFLSNAIKFSIDGIIIVKVDIVDNFVVTQVIDQGIGINKKDLNKLFNPFIQLDGGLSRSHEGTGLGLAICKNLIEKLGGTIQVQSKVGKGSNFSFSLPLDNDKSITH